MSKAASERPEPSDIAYGRSLKGLGFNLLVTDVPRAVAFATEALGARSFDDDEEFAALRWRGQSTRGTGCVSASSSMMTGTLGFRRCKFADA